MKRFITTIALLISFIFSAYCQPIITRSLFTVPTGEVDSIYAAPVTIPPGSGGAAITWDFSGLSIFNQGFATVIDPATSPYASTFPTANLCIQYKMAGNDTMMYSYDSVSSSNWDWIATKYYGPGTGHDYSPNPESNLKFPFNYNTSYTDTFKTAISGLYTVTITYDGYGTLKTPLATYSNVVRIHRYRPPADTDIVWFITSPNLWYVMEYDGQHGVYLLTSKTTAGLQHVSTLQSSIHLYPNPFSDNAILKIDHNGDLKNTNMVISDLSGHIVKRIVITGNETIINRNGLADGIYFYQVFCNGETAKGKFVVQ